MYTTDMKQGVVQYVKHKQKERGGLQIENRQARHNYQVLETLECGIVLKGTEIKSIRDGRANLKDAWATVEDGVCILKQMHISPYEFGNRFNVDPMRERILLLHKREIRNLADKLTKEGLTLIPLKLYMSKGKCKIALGVCKGKKLYDKRADEAKKDANRQIERALKNN